MHRAVHFKCKDMDGPQQTEMTDDKTEAILFAKKGLAS